MDDNKKKYAYWMKPSLVQEIEDSLEEANATSKSDFVCMAVDFYIGYLRQQKSINYLAPVLAGTIRETHRHRSQWWTGDSCRQAEKCHQ